MSKISFMKRSDVLKAGEGVRCCRSHLIGSSGGTDPSPGGGTGNSRRDVGQRAFEDAVSGLRFLTQMFSA